MYVPNAHKWVKYYENMAKGYHNPYIDQSGGKIKQIGGSLTGTRGSFIVPVDEATTSVNTHQSTPMKVELVSPSQQVVEQAKSEIQVKGKAMKRNRRRKSHSLQKRRRTVKTSKRSKDNKNKKTRKIAKKSVIRRRKKAKNIKKNFRKHISKKTTQETKF